MSETDNINCETARDQLDMLIEAVVDARIKAEASSALDSPAGVNQYEQDQAALEPAGALKAHLNTCNECHNYQLANRVIIEAARALPRPVADDALTASIMSMIEHEHMLQMDGSMTPAQIEAGSKTKIEKGGGKPPASRETKHFTWSLQNPWIMALSFLAFVLIAGTTGATTTEAMWSAGSWILALGMVALLKPLAEGNFNNGGAKASAAKA